MSPRGRYPGTYLVDRRVLRYVLPPGEEETHAYDPHVHPRPRPPSSFHQMPL